MNEIERELRHALRDCAGAIVVADGLLGVQQRVRRRRAARRILVVGAAAASVFVALGTLAVMATDQSEVETANLSESDEPTTTSSSIPTTSTLPTTVNPVDELPECTPDSGPEPTPGANGAVPGPTFVPQDHFEGLDLSGAVCLAARRGLEIRVWNVDWVEVAPEAFGTGSTVNLSLVDEVVVVAEWAPPAKPSTDPQPTATVDTTLAPTTGSLPETTGSTEAPRVHPGPTFVPELNFVGETLAEAEQLAAELQVILRVWRIDGVQVLPEASESPAVNIEVADGIVTAANSAPSAPTPTTPPTTLGPTTVASD